MFFFEPRTILNFDLSTTVNTLLKRYIMKTTITQKLMGLAFSLLSLASFGQCAQITGLNVTYGANGTATVIPSMTGSTSPMLTTYYWQSSAGVSQTGWGSQGEFQFPANGYYQVCVQYNDSSTFCTDYLCDSLHITNMSPNSCNAAFTYYTDSSCVTHFNNTSVGSNLTYQWVINGTTYTTSINPAVNLPNGNYNAFLYTYSNGVFCDSAYQNVYVNCGGGNPSGGCNASFSYYPDTTSCNTHFYNLSTGSNLTYEWRDMTGGFALLSTLQNPSLTLSTGNHYIALYTYSNNQFCDSATALVSVTCSTLTPPCQANASFSLFADSTNTGNYFAYNLSSGTGSLSYLWDFGDGTTSTQQYPFHQYATPGHYVLCLTVTATNGSVTCSDTYCDSSSVHRMSSGFLMNQIQVIPQSVTSVKDQDLIKGFKTFPNPMGEELFIEIELNATSHTINYQLVDALGKVITKNSMTDSKATIKTSALDKGFYFLQVTDEKGSMLKTTKLVK